MTTDTPRREAFEKLRAWHRRFRHNMAMSPFPLSQKIGGLIALAMFVGACILYATGHHV